MRKRCTRGAKKKREIASSQSREVQELIRHIQRDISAQHYDLDAWEQRMRDVVLASGARALESALAGVGCGRRKQPLVCHCGATMRAQGIAHKDLGTTLGVIRWGRSYFTCPVCDASVFPGDQLLRVEGTKYTPGLQRLSVRAGSKTSFVEGESDLLAYAGLRVPAREIERMTLAAGTELQRRNAAEIQQLTVASGRNIDLHLPPSIPIMYISFDGTGVPMRREEVAGRRGKQPDGSAKTREVKLGCVFTQVTTDKDGYPVREPNSTSYVGAIETSEQCGRRIYGEAVRRGLQQAETVVVLCDGAGGNRPIADLHFPNAIFIIDLFHARQHLHNAADILVPPGRRERIEKRWVELLDEGKVERLIRHWRLLLPQHGPRRRAALTEINYFSTNAKAMRYADFRRQGLFIGSGVIEAGCRTLIGKRLKQSGMFWSVPGANGVIALRCAIYSDRFEQFWADRAA